MLHSHNLPFSSRSAATARATQVLLSTGLAACMAVPAVVAEVKRGKPLLNCLFPCLSTLCMTRIHRRCSRRGRGTRQSRDSERWLHVTAVWGTWSNKIPTLSTSDYSPVLAHVPSSSKPFRRNNHSWD